MLKYICVTGRQFLNTKSYKIEDVQQAVEFIYFQVTDLHADYCRNLNEDMTISKDNYNF